MEEDKIAEPEGKPKQSPEKAEAGPMPKKSEVPSEQTELEQDIPASDDVVTDSASEKPAETPVTEDEPAAEPVPDTIAAEEPELGTEPTELEKIQTELAETQEKLKKVEGDLAQAKANTWFWQTRQGESEAELEEIKKSLMAEVRRLNQEAQAAIAAREEAVGALDLANSQIGIIQSEKKQLLDEREELAEKIRLLENLLNKENELNPKISELENAVAELAQQNNELKIINQQLALSLSQAEAKVSDDDIEELHRAIAAEFQARLDAKEVEFQAYARARESELETSRQNVRVLLGNAEELRQENSELKTKLLKAETKLQSLSVNSAPVVTPEIPPYESTRDAEIAAKFKRFQSR